MPRGDTKLKDNSGDRKYFVQTPMLAWAAVEDPYELALWFVIKMIAWEGGECTLSTEDLATLAMMSTGKVSQCRARLLELGLLEGELRKDPEYPQPVWHLTIPDIWKENIEWAERFRTITSKVDHKTLQRNDKAERKAALKSLHRAKGTADEPSSHEEGIPPGEEGIPPGEEGIPPGEEGIPPGETTNIYIDPVDPAKSFGKSLTTTKSVDPNTKSSSSRSGGQHASTKKPTAFYKEIQTAIESNGFGMMTPIMASVVNEMIDTYPEEWIKEAMRKAVESNKLSLNYVRGILQNWQRDGYSYDSRKHHSDRKGQRYATTKGSHSQTPSATTGGRQLTADEEWLSQYGNGT